MDQQQTRVSFSLGTKLLLSVGILLFVVIVFISISTILILREDRRAYTYQSQSNESVLIGREFVNLARHSIDILKVGLASVDPKVDSTPAQQQALQAQIENQTGLLTLSVQYLNLATGETTPYLEVQKTAALDEAGVPKDPVKVDSARLLAIVEELKKNGFAFVNTSKAPDLALLAIVLADTSLASLPQGMPIAVGTLSLKDLGAQLRGTQMTIMTSTGGVLYDTDASILFGDANLKTDPIFTAALSAPLSAGAKEVDEGGQHYLGSYVRPGLGVVVMTKTKWERAMRATYAVMEKFVLLGGMALGAAVIFALIFAKTLTGPLNRLYEATRKVSSGNFDVQLKERSHDEIGALSGSFNAMSQKIVELIRESMEKVQLENELAIASTVQQTLIPPPEFKNKMIHIHSHYRSASTCGGDWWGFFGVGNRLAFMIADATGHGFPSALITASARSCFSVMQKLAQEDPEFTFSPAAMLAYANRVIFDASMGKIMMTFFVGVVDFSEGTLTYASAGHNPPWLFKKKGGRFEGKSLVANGMRLGEMRDAPEFQEKSMPVAEGDILFLYTDGLTEGKDTAGEMYGKKRARKLVEALLAAGPGGLIQGVVADFMKHNANKELDDDLTVAAAQILQVAPAPSPAAVPEGEPSGAPA